jgi:DNA repair exonuclease SbcCD nuclease subunit
VTWFRTRCVLGTASQVYAYFMSEIKFLSSSDEHIAESVGFRKDDYRSAILNKLEWQGSIARKFKADGILRGGDLFHVKAANKTTMSTLAKVSAIHRKYPCPTYIIAGNHDISHNSLDTVLKQPLGVVLEAGVCCELSNEVFLSGSLKVRVIGVGYTVDLDHGGLREIIQKNDEDCYTIAVIHALASMAPEERIQSFFNEKIFDYRDLVFPGCPDAYIFGHYHKDQGIVEHCGVKFINLGAISRGALNFENIERKPKVGLITCDSRGINAESIEVPCGDALSVFDFEKKAQLEKERKNIDEFISKLYSDSTLSQDGGLSEKLEKLKLSEYSEDLKGLVLNTLEQAETGVIND